MMTNALTVDLEEYFHVSNFEHLIDSKKWSTLPSRVEWATHQLLDAFDASQSRATFFVLGWVAERHPGLLREIARRGHEIACHGYQHQLVYEIGPDGFRRDLRRGKAAIEDSMGIRVDGYRAPSYSITRESAWALEILAEEGFTYDSSIFPIRHPRYGVPGFDRLPLRLRLPSGDSIREFPLTTLSVGRFSLPLAGGAYLRFFPPMVFLRAFLHLVQRGTPTVLYLHPWEIDPGQPRQAVNWRVRINHYYNLDRMEGRVRRLLDQVPFQTMREVLAELDRSGGLPLHDLRATPLAQGLPARHSVEPIAA